MASTRLSLILQQEKKDCQKMCSKWHENAKYQLVHFEFQVRNLFRQLLLRILLLSVQGVRLSIQRNFKFSGQ